MPKPVIFAVGPEFLERDHLANQVGMWEDGQRAPTVPDHFEWWYFDAHFEDGTTVVIVYATKPIINPRSPLMPNLSLTITRYDGTKIARFALPPANQFSVSQETCNIHLGQSWVEQSEHDGCWTYRIHAEAGDLSTDLTFNGLVPPWRLGAGKTYFGDLNHYFAWLPSIPFGSVAGRLTYDGEDHQVNGTGYHDHNWGNVALSSVMDHWTWGRAHVGEYTLIFVEQIAAKKYGYTRIPVFMLVKGRKVLAEDSRYFTMQGRDLIHHPGGREYPRECDFTWERGSDQIRLVMREPKLIEAVSLLMALPPVKRWLAHLFVNPYYFRFNSALDLEIKKDGLCDHLRGQALYEIMMLK